jgi:HAD superfamily hydrolase (TIGR01509 family)
MRLWKEKYGIELEVEKFSKEAGNMEIKMMANKQVNLDLLCLLKELKANKFPMGVGTSSLRWRAEEIIRLLRIKGYFSVIVSAEDVVHHKPNPDLFLKVAEELKVPPGNCVVIEDASSGIEAAKRGGMKAIGYLTDYNNPEELKKADLIISSFKELDSEKIKILFE